MRLCGTVRLKKNQIHAYANSSEILCEIKTKYNSCCIKYVCLLPVSTKKSSTGVEQEEKYNNWTKNNNE